MPDVSASADLFLIKSLTPIEVLVVENNSADALNTLAAFRTAGFTNCNHCVREGKDALMYLRREGPYSGVRVPHMIYLDLLRPKMSGLHALKVMKSTPALMDIPVVVAADSEDPGFVEAVHSLSGGGFIGKPPELSEFLRSIEPFYEYWISVVALNSQAQDQPAAATAAIQS